MKTDDDGLRIMRMRSGWFVFFWRGGGCGGFMNVCM